MAIATRNKPNTAAHRKRSGKHHRHTDTYLKHYWPYIPMLLIVGLGLMVNSMWSHSSVLSASSDFSDSTLLQTTNQQRSADHESSLTLDQRLDSAAQAKADDMASHDYWSHTSPDGKSPWSFIAAAGYNYQAAGENLAYGFQNANDVITAWMNSPAHRANVLGANYTNVGFGVAQSPNYQGKGPETIVVAEYGQPAETAAAAGGTAGAQDTGITGPSKPVTRLPLLSGQAGWSTVAASAVAGAALMWLIIRNGRRLKRLAGEGERFVLQHPMLDILIVFAGTMAMIFAQAGGVIH